MISSTLSIGVCCNWARDARSEEISMDMLTPVWAGLVPAGLLSNGGGKPRYYISHSTSGGIGGCSLHQVLCDKLQKGHAHVLQEEMVAKQHTQHKATACLLLPGCQCIAFDPFVMQTAESARKMGNKNSLSSSFSRTSCFVPLKPSSVFTNSGSGSR